jgi:hypothetical protein
MQDSIFQFRQRQWDIRESKTTATFFHTKLCIERVRNMQSSTEREEKDLMLKIIKEN